MVDELKGIPLWDEFYKKADERQRLMVMELAGNAADRLDRVIETFPNYTLHNRVHARNVVTGMSNLLGDKVEQISALEGAILILSAYLHDIGMVFTSEERQNLATEERFSVFLCENAAALVALDHWRRQPGNPPDGVPADVAEWYCRWAHAERVHYYLRELDISWNNASLRKVLRDVLRKSQLRHPEIVESTLATGFLGQSGPAVLRHPAAPRRYPGFR
jgi:hypothetical protein